MERLLSSSSSSPTPLKKISPFLPRFPRIDSPKLHCPSFSRPRFWELNSFSCKYDYSFLPSPIASSFNNLLSLTDSQDGSSPKSNSLQQIEIRPSAERMVISQVLTVFILTILCQYLYLLGKLTEFHIPKFMGKIAGTFVVLCVAILVLIQPGFAPSAFASLHSSAKTGGPAAATIGGRFIRSELLSSAWTGFFAGCLHTLSGPDHLAALAPLSIGRTRMESAAVGALWGCGHDAGQVIFGLIFLLLKDRLHIEVLRTWGTRVVGITLLVIGAMGIREASEVPTPCVALENGECDVSVYEALENPTPTKKKIGFATFATGIVHGLQPDALMMILPALALPSRLAGAAFLAMFLVGTVVAMGSYTVFIGSCSQALKDRVPRITEKLTWASSFVAIALGFAILISQFFGYSLY